MAEGSQTSISVEPDFWEQFRLIVIERRTTISNLLAEIERTMRLLPDQGKGYDRTLTLSAAVRVFVLRTVMSQLSSQRGARRRTTREECGLCLQERIPSRGKTTRMLRPEQ